MELCGRSAVVQEGDKEFLGNDRSGNCKRCFCKTRDAYRSNGRLAGRGQMMSCNTDGAIVVACLVLMVMEHHHERRNEKMAYEE